jgi:hypothetical protein
MNPRLLQAPALALLAISALPALAQTPAPGPASTPAPTVPALVASQPLTIPPSKCVQPPYPGRLAANSAINAFNRDNKAYGDCVKRYVDDTKAWVMAVVEAGNKAIDEYNKYTEDLKKKIEEAKE